MFESKHNQLAIAGFEAHVRDFFTGHVITVIGASAQRNLFNQMIGQLNPTFSTENTSTRRWRSPGQPLHPQSAKRAKTVGVDTRGFDGEK